MSGLLVKSTLIMRDNLEELNARGPVGASRCCSAAPRSPAPTSSATCARSTRAACSTARTPSRACASWTASARSSAAPATTTPTGAACPSESDGPVARPGAVRRRRRAAGRPARPLARGRSTTTRSSCRRSSARRSSRASPSTTSPPTSTRPRCSATSGSSGPRGGEDDDEFKDRIRPDAARAAGRGQGRRPPRAPGRLRLLRRPTATATTSSSGRTRPAPPSGCGSRSPASARSRTSASPTSSGRSTRGEVDYAAFHIVTMGAAVSERDGRAVRRRPVPGLPAAARPRRRDGRGAGRVLAPPHPRGVGLRRRGRPDARRACSASSTAAAATRGATRPAPTSRTTRRSPSCSTADRIGIEVSEETGFQYQPEQTTSRHHLPPPPGQVLRRPLDAQHARQVVATCRVHRRWHHTSDSSLNVAPVESVRVARRP